MTRIAVLGNSHVAAVKLAWAAQQPKFAGIEVTFFAAWGVEMGGLCRKGQTLVPATEKLKQSIRHTSGGLDIVDPRDYEALVLYGLGLSPYRIPEEFFSSKVLDRAVSDHVRKRPSWSLAGMLREISDLPIFIVPEPLRAFQASGSREAPEDAYAIAVQMIRTTFRSLDVTVLPQPPVTITAGFFTKPEFSIGSRGLEVREGQKPRVHPNDDDNHMNERYGAAFLETYLPRMADVSRAP